MDRCASARHESRAHVSDIVLVDTSILVNVLGVPTKSDQQDEVTDAMTRHVERGDMLVLPAATVLETGNHIAQNGDGNQRRACAMALQAVVEQAIEGMPWQLVPLPENPVRFASLLTDFPNCAMRGVGFGDLSIIEAWNDACRRFRGRIAIWSLDGDLKGFDRPAG